jgi:hypothetical protein
MIVEEVSAVSRRIFDDHEAGGRRTADGGGLLADATVSYVPPDDLAPAWRPTQDAAGSGQQADPQPMQLRHQSVADDRDRDGGEDEGPQDGQECYTAGFQVV